jgi:hypothetical protein
MAYGTELLSVRLVPDRAGPDVEAEHAGRVTVYTANVYGLYGLSHRFNLLVKVPWVSWNQVADEPDAHHRTQSIVGVRDVTAGLRWIVRNQVLGPGQRLFFGWNVTWPTARSYATNPFSAAADTVSHTHFALGSGQVISDVNGEWWYRSEFPYVIGVTGTVSFSWGASPVGYRSGTRSVLVLHGIRQAAVFPHTFLYLRFTLRREQPDVWEGVRAPNSGGSYLDGMVGLNFEITEEISGVLSLEYPLWRDVAGAQLEPRTLAFSIRRVLP